MRITIVSVLLLALLSFKSKAIDSSELKDINDISEVIN